MDSDASGISLEDSLFKTQKVQDEEARAREKAIALGKKLLLLRDKKEQEVEQKVKELLVQHYQRKIEEFKVDVDKEVNSELASLKLVKEFKMNQIVEVEQLAIQTLNRLRKSLEEGQQLERELEENYRSALEFLDNEQRRQTEETMAELEIRCAQKIKSFTQSIEIQ